MDGYEIPTGVSLATIAAVLAVSVLVSLLRERRTVEVELARET